MRVKLYIGTDLLDTFDDEDINVKSAITDAEDISKNVGDFSRSFTVPASDNNNQIFVNYYNADIDNTFDARTKVDGRIELDGIPFKVGKWRLSKVNVKSGLPSSYTINFFGRTVSFKDLFKKDELNVLDFSAYDHTYNDTNVKTGLTSSLFSGVIKYPLLAKKQYYYNADASDGTITDSLANIAFNGTLCGVRWDDLQPSIKLITIIEAIETYYGITFTRDFFGRAEFDNIYMWLNQGKENASTIGGGTIEVDFDGGSTTYVDLDTNEATVTPILDYSPGHFDDVVQRNFLFLLYINPVTGYETTPYTVLAYKDDVLVSENEYTGADNWGSFATSTTATSGIPQVWRWEIRTEETFSFSATLQINTRERETISDFIDTVSTDFTFASSDTITSTVTVSTILPKIKIIDFLRGIFKMFKLVVVPTSNTNVYVNTLDSYYSQGRLWDITEYVDFKSYDVERGKIFNELNFNFQEPQTLLNQQFEINNAVAYGDEELLLEDENGEPLDGEKLDIELPFEQVLYERLTDQDSNAQTNVQYGAIIDDQLEPVGVKPHLHYIINQEVGALTVGFVNISGTVEELATNINLPSHTDDFTDMNYFLSYGSEYSTWNGELITGTLYQNYYSQYVTSVFNIKRRTWKFSAYLPTNVTAGLDLNDIIQIKERFYRINSYNLNLTNGKSDLELINSFDNKIDPLTATQTIFIIDSQGRTVSAYISGTEDFTTDKNSVGGDGVTWVTITTTGRNVFFEVDQNLTSDQREMYIVVENTAKTKLEEIIIIQLPTYAVLDFSSPGGSQYLNTLLIGKP